MRSGSFWLGMLLMVIAIVVKDTFLAIIRRSFYYTNDDIVQEVP